MPQAPPAIATAVGEVGDDEPWYLTMSCFRLSYDMKYTEVPMVSRTDPLSLASGVVSTVENNVIVVSRTHMQANSLPET